MRILEIEIENFKNIKYFKANTNANVVFVIGGNGSGKTSIIDAIYWCLLGRRVNSLYYDVAYIKKSSRVKLKIENNNMEYILEVKVKKEDDDFYTRFFIGDSEGVNEYPFAVYSQYVKVCVLNDFFYENNFIGVPCYKNSKVLICHPLICSLKELNLFANKLGFPIKTYKLAFDDCFIPNIYLGKKKLSGGYYSEADNVLRFIWGRVVEIKYVEKKTLSCNPIFIDDAFEMFSDEYKMKIFMGLKRLRNQMFITQKHNLGYNNQETSNIIEINLDNYDLF